MKGSKILVKTLLCCGVQTVFGYPGNYVLDIYDELYANRSRIRHVETCHEQHACHAADGYARSSGRTGVVLATSGPGATNLVTGIASAYMDSVPLVAITGNVPAAILGKDNFQEVDIAGITMPVTKHNFIVKHVAELEETLVRAFEIAGSGRKGPVLVDLPHDTLTGSAEFKGLEPVLRAPDPVSDENVRLALQLLREAKRPLILAGGGILAAGAQTLLDRLLEQCNLPAVCTMTAVSAVPRSGLGMIGIYGEAEANRALFECDLLVALGTRFSDRVTNAFPKLSDKTVLHVDADRAELGKNVAAKLGICGDCGDFISKLLDILPKKPFKSWVRHSVPVKAEQSIPSVRTRKPVFENVESSLSAYAGIFGAVRECLPAVNLATDVGLHQVYAARRFPFASGDRFVSSCGLGAMGFGLGAAIGACLGNGLPSVLVTGDGSFRMNLAELATLKVLGLPVTILVCNNRSLGMVRRLQEKNFGGRFFETDGPDTDFSLIARAFGIPGERANGFEAARQLLARHDYSKPGLIDMVTVSEDLL